MCCSHSCSSHPTCAKSILQYHSLLCLGDRKRPSSSRGKCWITVHFNEVKGGWGLWIPLAVRQNVSSTYKIWNCKTGSKQQLPTDCSKRHRAISQGTDNYWLIYKHADLRLHLPFTAASLWLCSGRERERVRNVWILKEFSPLLPFTVISTMQCLETLCVCECVCACVSVFVAMSHTVKNRGVGVSLYVCTLA